MTKSPTIVTVSFGANAAIADCPAFICPEEAEYELVEVMENHRVAGTDGGAVSLDIVHADSGEAIAAGITALSGTLFNLKSTADTPVRRSTASGLSTTRSARVLQPGDRHDLDFQGTLTALAGVCVTLVYVLRRQGVRR